MLSSVWLFPTPWTIAPQGCVLCPWNSPGKNTRVGSHSLLRGSSQPRDRAWFSWIEVRFFTIWAPLLIPKWKSRIKMTYMKWPQLLKTILYERNSMICQKWLFTLSGKLLSDFLYSSNVYITSNFLQWICTIFIIRVMKVTLPISFCWSSMLIFYILYFIWSL